MSEPMKTSLDFFTKSTVLRILVTKKGGMFLTGDTKFVLTRTFWVNLSPQFNLSALKNIPELKTLFTNRTQIINDCV